jgi:hypothetical protein
VAAEQIVLDPVELMPERFQVDITPWVKAEPGVEWGDANVVPYKAQGERGEQVIDFKLENRQIGIPLALRTQGGTSFATIRSTVQAVVARWMSEGGVIRRTTKAGGTVYADIPIAGMAQGGNFLQALERGDTDAELHLEAIPDFYEPEVELTSSEEKTLPELIKVIPDPGGDMPARVRLVVEEKQGVDQKGLIWAFRSRYYSAAATAKSAYSATELQPLGEAAKEAVTGATGGTAVSNTALPAVWTPVVGTNLGGTAWLTHQGTYRIKARLRSPQGTAVSARFVWDVGDLVNPTENKAFTFPAGSAWFDADLGEVRLQAPPVGTYRWQGQIQAKGTEGGEDINVDRIWIVNSDEGMGVLSAPPQSSSSQETIKAWDNFNTTTAGTITGKVAPLGGTWAGAGDAVGFTVDTTNKWITREEKSDADQKTGYFARLGTFTAAKVEVALDLKLDENLAEAPMMGGAFFRYTNTSNWGFAGIQSNSGEGFGDRYWPVVYKCVAGTLTRLGNGASIGKGLWKSMRVTVDASGNVAFYLGNQGATLGLVLALTDSVFASAGTLETGGFGIYDVKVSSGVSVIRRYDNLYVYAPAVSSPISDAVLYASQKAQLTTKGMYRLDPGGTAYGPVSRVIGDLPRLPAGGLENRSTELFLKWSRGDFEQVADSAIDDGAVKVFANRSWLTVPGTI